MTFYQIAILAAYILIQGFSYWLRRININHMKKYGLIVPRGFEQFIDKGLLEKTIAYTTEKSSFGLIESLFGNIVTVLFIFFGFLRLYDSWIASLNVGFIFQGMIFFLLLTYIQELLSIPFSLYSTFRIENRYGFNTMTLKLWLADLAKSTLISTVISGILLVSGLWIVQSSPKYWWLFVWFTFFIFSIFMMYISPYVIEPLFNKFTPLEGHELEDRIKAMMSKAGITIGKVFTIDASKRSRHSNAYFTGIGKVKRIVLYDTLMSSMTSGEIMAILAHEAGHWKKKHVIKMIAFFEALSLAAAYAAYRLIGSGSIEKLFHLQTATFPAKLVILGFLLGMVSFPFTPLFSYLSRRHEREADRFANDLTGDPESLATSLIKLSKDNLSNLHPHPLFASFYYSHPPVVQRVAAIRGIPKSSA